MRARLLCYSLAVCFLFLGGLELSHFVLGRPWGRFTLPVNYFSLFYAPLWILAAILAAGMPTRPAFRKPGFFWPSAILIGVHGIILISVGALEGYVYLALTPVTFLLLRGIWRGRVRERLMGEVTPLVRPRRESRAA